jgi:hypothetical protein
MSDPVLVIQVPLDGLADAGLKGFFRFPAELITNLGRINRIASIVSRPIFNKGDLILVRLAILAGFEFV